MAGRMRIRRLSLMLLCASVVGGCDGLFGPQVICGPLEISECEEEVQEIRNTLRPEFPDRRIVFVEFLNENGDANVRLDDGTEVGWGGGKRL